MFNQSLSKIWILLTVIILIVGVIFICYYLEISKKRAKKWDSFRKSELQLIATYQETYYTSYGHYYQSVNYPLEIFIWTDPKTGNSYGWSDNTKDNQKFCVYANLENGGFYVVSHYGTGEIATEPCTFSDCEKVPNVYSKVKTGAGINITFPVGGEQWNGGENQSISWEQWGLIGKKLKICLMGSDISNIPAKGDYQGKCSDIEGYQISEVYAESGRYIWTIPVDLSKRFLKTPASYRIKIMPVEEVSAKSISYGFSDDFIIFDSIQKEK